MGCEGWGRVLVMSRILERTPAEMRGKGFYRTVDEKSVGSVSTIRSASEDFTGLTQLLTLPQKSVDRWGAVYPVAQSLPNINKRHR